MKSGVFSFALFAFVFFLALSVSHIPSASAYVVDFTLDGDSYMCGSVVHGVMRTGHYSNEVKDDNRTFTFHLSPPGPVNPNAELSCTIRADGFMLTRCNGFGDGLRQIKITKVGTARAISHEVSQDEDSSGIEGTTVDPYGDWSHTDYGNHNIPIGDGTYDVWIDTGVYVDDATGTCSLGTYGIFVDAYANEEHWISSYRAYEVFSVANLTDNTAGTESIDTQSDTTSNQGGSHGGSKKSSQTGSGSSSSSSISLSYPKSASTETTESITVPGTSSAATIVDGKSWGLSAFLLVMILGIMVAIFVRTRAKF